VVVSVIIQLLEVYKLYIITVDTWGDLKMLTLGGVSSSTGFVDCEALM
jgi:hypothetical protein